MICVRIRYMGILWTLYIMCVAHQTSCSAALGSFNPLMNWRRREYGNSPLCSAGLNEWRCTLIRPLAFVALVSLPTVFWLVFVSVFITSCGPGSSVGIATDCGLGGPGSNPGGDEIFRPSRPAPASCKMGTGSFPGVKCCRGLLLTTHTLLVPRSWKGRAIPVPALWATPGL